MEQDPNLGRRAYELDSIVASTIVSDLEPYERTDHIEHVIGQRGGVAGEYLLRTYYTQVEDLDEFGNDGKQASGQALHIRHEGTSDELTVIDFSYHPQDGVSLFFNKDVLELMDHRDFFTTDFVKYPMIYEILSEAQESGKRDVDFIMDSPMMWLMRANSEWVFMDELPDSTTFKYSVFSNGTLCTVKTEQSLSNGTNRVISVQSYDNLDEHEVQLFKQGGFVTITKPQQADKASQEINSVYRGLNNIFS